MRLNDLRNFLSAPGRNAHQQASLSPLSNLRFYELAEFPPSTASPPLKIARSSHDQSRSFASSSSPRSELALFVASFTIPCLPRRTAGFLPKAYEPSPCSRQEKAKYRFSLLLFLSLKSKTPLAPQGERAEALLPRENVSLSLFLPTEH